MLQIIQHELELYSHRELSYGQTGLRKCRGRRDSMVNVYWAILKTQRAQGGISMCFIQCSEASDHVKLWKVLRKIGIPEHLIVLMRNIYTDQQASVRTENGQTGSRGTADRSLCRYVICASDCENLASKEPAHLR